MMTRNISKGFSWIYAMALQWCTRGLLRTVSEGVADKLHGFQVFLMSNFSICLYARNDS